jgi:hypothetical protein
MSLLGLEWPIVNTPRVKARTDKPTVIFFLISFSFKVFFAGLITGYYQLGPRIFEGGDLGFQIRFDLIGPPGHSKAEANEEDEKGVDDKLTL